MTSSTPSTELRKRGPGYVALSSPSPSKSQSETSESEDEKKPTVLEVDSPERWQKWSIRVKSSIVMFVAFLFILYMGHLAVAALIIALQIFGTKEIWDIRLQKLKKEKKESDVLPVVRSLDWFFFFSTIYFCYGRFLVWRFGTNYEDTLYGYIYSILGRHHSLICFSMFTFGLVCFVLSLKKKWYKFQFIQLGWCVVTLSLTTVQSCFCVYNTFEGLFWVFVPAGLVITNDVWAYIFGFFFGRTPLIRISPKKTWEGFIGASIMTFITAFIGSYILGQIPYFYCPRDNLFHQNLDCQPHYVFQFHEYNLVHDHPHIHQLLSLVGFHRDSVWLLPVQLHSFALAAFCACIAPFGGFFASGFKRAFKIKDFADTIPGHGGITDRMDCQLLMGVFVWVYLNNFIYKPSTTASIISSFNSLKTNDQLELYHQLGEILTTRGLFNATI